MKRLLATIRCDLRLQMRNGFYYAVLFVLVVYALGFSRLSGTHARQALVWLAPAMLLNNLLVTTFYFVGGLVLLEKNEGSLEAQIVTPLRGGEYLASKVITLTLLALVYNIGVAALIAGFSFALLPLACGVAIAAALFTLFGFVAVARYASINEYLLPSTVYVAPLLLPLLYVAGWNSPLLYLHPFQAPMVLLQAAFAPAPVWHLVYGVVYGGAWVGVAYLLCRRSFRRFVVEKI